MFNDSIATPLRLAVGSHQKGSGKGCAMNVISWENGDKTITDYPDCVDIFLTKIVQRVNDRICSHRDGSFLCPKCSIKVLTLAHRTVGTNLLATHTNYQRAEIYAKIARTELFYAAADAYAAAGAYDVAAANAANAAADAANAAADAAANAAVDAYADAVAAVDAYYANAAYDANAAEFLMEQGHRIIDQFEAFSGIKATPVDNDTVTWAISQMCVVR